MNAQRLRAGITKVFWITVAWTIFSIFQFFIAYGSIMDLGFKVQDRELSRLFLTSIFSGVLAGVLGGSMVVFYWERWLRNKPYGWAIRNGVISYIGIFILVGYPSNLFFQSNRLNLPVLSPEVLSEALKRLLSPMTLIPLTIWMTVVVITLIALLVNDKYGPGVFRKFLLGRYFNPRKEERIFMFLDLRSSTAVAEKLGEEKYFSFLKDVFKYATPSILKYKGEIYQYVGDEIVVSWELGTGVKDANCIRCFFEIRESLGKKNSYFQDNYNTFPEFKAGIHYGHVMAGEIGVVKREIAFSGDVLNTAARIQSKCNELGANLLVSKHMIERLQLDEPFVPQEMGEVELRGKQELVTLYALA